MTSARQSGADEALITGEELARMPDHDLCELIDGRIVPMSPANPVHGRIELNVGALLRSFVGTKNLGIVMTGEVGIFTKRRPDRVRGADVLFISHERYQQRITTLGFLDVVPELVVEILSREHAHIDMREKVAEYLKAGVLLVLVLDPDTRTIVAHRPDASISRYATSDSVPCDDVLPGFALSVAAAFE